MDNSSRFYQDTIEPIEDRMIRSVWRITRNAQDAEDAMQNALVRIWKRRSRIHRHQVPQALILKICVDAACDVVRRRLRHQNKVLREHPAPLLIDGARSPCEELVSREIGEDIVAAVNRLGRRQAVAITLRLFEDLPYEQIAAAMNCSEATARKHVERARGHLRLVLSKHEPSRPIRS